MNCVKLNRILCKEQFINHNDFKNHILKDDNHLNFISIKFDININDKDNSNYGIIPGIYQDPTKPRHYLNLLNKARKVNIGREGNINFENVVSLIQIK